MACLPDPKLTAKSLRPGHKVIAVGWGATESRFDYIYAETLQQAVFTVMSAEGTSLFEPEFQTIIQAA